MCLGDQLLQVFLLQWAFNRIEFMLSWSARVIRAIERGTTSSTLWNQIETFPNDFGLLMATFVSHGWFYQSLLRQRATQIPNENNLKRCLRIFTIKILLLSTRLEPSFVVYSFREYFVALYREYSKPIRKFSRTNSKRIDRNEIVYGISSLYWKQIRPKQILFRKTASW